MRRRLLTGAALAVALLSSAPVAAAQTDEPAAAQFALASAAPLAQSAAAATNRLEAGFTPLQVPLEIAGRPLGDIDVEVDTTGRGRVDANRLVALLRPALDQGVVRALEARVAGRDRVSFEDASGEGLAIVFDPGALTLRAEIAAAASAVSRLRMQNGAAAPNPTDYDAPARFAAGLTLGLGQAYAHEEDPGFRDLAGLVDGYVSIGGFRGPTLFFGAEYDEGAEDAWRRREARLVVDLYERAVRFTAGEFTPRVASLQGSSQLLGFSVERAFGAIRPFQNVRPTGRRDFILERDSNVEVFVNEVSVSRLRLQPGRYSLSDFPFARGPNDVRIVVEDDAGRNEIAVFGLFNGSELLDRGVLDFSASVGVLEEGRLEYGDTWAATAQASLGVTDDVTLGLNGQAVEDRAQAGLLAAFGTRLGLFQLEAVGSRNDEKSGAAASLDWRHDLAPLGADLQLNASIASFARNFQNAFSLFPPDNPRWLAAAQARLGLPGGWSFTAGGGASEGRTAPDTRTLNLTLSKSIGRVGLSGTFSRSDTRPGVRDDRFLIGLALRLGQRWNASTRYDTGADRFDAEVSRGARTRIGDLSGRLAYTRDRRDSALAGDLRYLNNRFDAELSHNRRISRTPDDRAPAIESRWRAATFVGFADGMIGVGRPAPSGFVIAPRHSSLRNAKVVLNASGDPVARSGWFGPALAPIAQEYGVNRFDLDVDPLPQGYDLGDGVISVFPKPGLGYRQMIGSDASRTAIGNLVGPEGPIALVGGLVRETGAAGGQPFFTNRAGRFVAERLGPGKYELVVGEKVIATFAIRKTDEGVVDVGTLRANP